MRETIRDATREPRWSTRIAALPRLRNGRSPQRRHRGSLTKGTPREQCRRRPQGHNGCEEDDRSSYPRFRSAPTDRQASVGCENFLQNSLTACPPTRPPGCRRAVSDSVCPPPNPRPGRRPRSRPRCPTRPPWSPPAARSRQPGVEHHVYATICLTTASGRSTCRSVANLTVIPRTDPISCA